MPPLFEGTMAEELKNDAVELAAARRSAIRKKRRRVRRQINVLIVLAILVVGVFLAVLIRNSYVDRGDELYGVWAYDEVTSYWFDGGGEGALQLPSVNYEFHYTIKEEQLEIDFISEEANDFSCRFQVDKDQLSFFMSENGEEEEMRLKKQ